MKITFLFLCEKSCRLDDCNIPAILLNCPSRASSFIRKSSHQFHYYSKIYMKLRWMTERHRPFETNEKRNDNNLIRDDRRTLEQQWKLKLDLKGPI